MRMRLLSALLALTALALPLHAANPAPTRVGLLVTGSTSDGGWNQLAAKSLDTLAKSDHLTVRTRQQVSKDTAPDAIRAFQNQHFPLVIAHGYEYLDVAKELTNPKDGNPVSIKIAVSGGDSTDPHFASLDYDLSGASYQLGIIAAKVSKTGKLGFIGGEPFPTVTAMKRGFEAGAKSVNPNITVSAQYTGWDDPSKSKTQAEAFMQQGVDVIMQNVDAASRGVFEAIAEHNKQNPSHPAYTFGANSDQNNNPVCPNYTLASAVIKLDLAFQRVIKQVQDGTFKGGLIKEDLASGVSIAVLNPKLQATVLPPDIQKSLDQAAKDLADGKATIPSE